MSTTNDDGAVHWSQWQRDLRDAHEAEVRSMLPDLPAGAPPDTVTVVCAGKVDGKKAVVRELVNVSWNEEVGRWSVIAYALLRCRTQLVEAGAAEARLKWSFEVPAPA